MKLKYIFLLIFLLLPFMTACQDECASGHAYTTWATMEEATCTETGAKMSVCDVCGEVHMEEIPAKGHIAGEWVVVENATVQNEGKKEKHCTSCEELLESESIAKVVEENLPKPVDPGSPTPGAPNGGYTDPNEEPDHSGGGVDTGKM